MNGMIKLDKAYSEWIKEISLRFKRSQIKAAASVNKEMLLFYWSLGRDISLKYGEIGRASCRERV